MYSTIANTVFILLSLSIILAPFLKKTQPIILYVFEDTFLGDSLEKIYDSSKIVTFGDYFLFAFTYIIYILVGMFGSFVLSYLFPLVMLLSFVMLLVYLKERV